MNVALSAQLALPLQGDDRAVSWRQGQWLMRKSWLQALAHGVAWLQSQPAGRVALYCDDALLFSLGWYACVLAGRIAVILPAGHPDYLAAVAGAYDLLWRDSDIEPWLLQLPASQPVPVLPKPPQADDAVATVFYTSGSTGLPQVVPKTLGQICTEILLLERCWGAGCVGAVFAGTVSQQHFYGFLFRCLWPLLTGRPLVAEPLRVPEDIQRQCQQHARVVLVSSPSLLTRLDTLPLAQLAPALCRVFSSGGALPAAAALRLATALSQPVTEIYGSTETGGIAWREQRGGEQAGGDRYGDCAWRLLPGMQMDAVDDGLQLTSPLLSAPMRLADTGVLLADGRLQLGPRSDAVVKVEGKRVSLSEIERQLLASPWVEQVRVILLSHPGDLRELPDAGKWPGGRELTAAVVVLNEQGAQALQQIGKPGLSRQLQQRLQRYFDAVVVPKKWRFVSALPVNDMGKTTHAALKGLFFR